ncbi:nuclear transport factor 2 family protein [Shewanella holmiensis]|uniref:Nuclear transport factor 2 family protein n=1 Tax=Shewanella holmiensis TaxID=2952222 RepID=A0A9X3AQM6_9GAMM|nr:nuclear transport factor 2 family protein [Shewanella holmiensis]MCT7943157.1 nuclear transport factor 2 family protein [Shewanella holmiensis]
MQSIIHRLGFIAVLITTVTAFDINANPLQHFDNENAAAEQAENTTKAAEVQQVISSQQSSAESEAVITNINQADHTIDSQGLTEEDSHQVNGLLNQLHESAISADWETYFNLYHPDAIFIGTDATERWNMVQFRAYATPTKGWRYDLQARHLLQIGDIIVFDEQLFSPAYGISRGTGALIQTAQGWKIAQYHLSFPIPNDKAKRITSLIMQ